MNHKVKAFLSLMALCLIGCVASIEDHRPQPNYCFNWEGPSGRQHQRCAGRYKMCIREEVALRDARPWANITNSCHYKETTVTYK